VRDLLVAPSWLHERLGDPELKVVDGSWYLPAQNRDARAEFLAGHIPGAEVTAALGSKREVVVDARSAARFAGTAPEPRPNLPSGHMPEARNLPFDRLVDSGGRLVPPDKVRAAFEAAGVDLSRPVVTTCGSGVTAALLLFSLATLGKRDVALYDGSWAEWASRPENPVATGSP
jgi:thiosulfate/3-mercaptopyruvate sulfurtransferase